MRLAASRWATVRGLSWGRETSLPPPLPLSFLYPATMQPCGRLLRLGAGLPPAPTASSLPCLHSGGLVQACLRRGTDLSSSSLFLPLSGAGADARHIPYLPFFLPSSSSPWRGHWRSLPRADKNACDVSESRPYMAGWGGMSPALRQQATKMGAEGAVLTKFI